MKVLAIDAGNTRIKWGLNEDGAWLNQGAVATVEAAALSHDFAKLAPPDRIVIANVAGSEAAQSLRAALDATEDRISWVVSRVEQCGVRSSYAEPARLGADRWAALIGARRRYAGACAVVNAGTTMTVDALSAEGIFLGGFIVPGFELMRESLARNTAHLARQDGRFAFFPDNTGDAITSGALNALAGAVERMMRYIAETGDDEPLVVISGGNAQLVAGCLSVRAELVDNLVLEGLVGIGSSHV
jgi:type III pantothenate kinase